MTVPFTAGTYDVKWEGRVTVTPTADPGAPPKPQAGRRLGGRVRLGAFVYDGLEGAGGRGDPWDPGPHLDLEAKLGRRLDPVSCFIGFDTDLPVQQLAAYGSRDILISWQPGAGVTAAAILAGKVNAYIDRFAVAVNGYTGGKIFVRLMPEFNGDWSRWSPAYVGGDSMGVADPAGWVKVWQYVVKRVAGKTNRVRWVWCPNITDQPYRPGNRLEEFYPGDAYVHVLGFDGYNWGDSGHGNHVWTSFADLLGKPQGGAAASIYDRLAALHPTLPIWWCEFGVKEPALEDGKQTFATPAVEVGLAPVNPGRSKAAWYSDMFDSVGFPRLDTVVAFNIVKERDWRLDSSPGVLEAIVAGLR